MRKLQNAGRLSVALAVVGLGLLAGTATAVASPADIATTPVVIPSGSSALSVQAPTCPPLPTPVSGPVTSLIVCPLAAPAAAPIAATPALVTVSGAEALQVVALLESLGIPAGSAELPFGSVLPCMPAPGVVCPLL